MVSIYVPATFVAHKLTISKGLVCRSNIILNLESALILLSSMGFLSSGSQYYSFDKRANKYARGKGVGDLSQITFLGVERWRYNSLYWYKSRR